ncbi:MAG: sodium-translocating pyrophosphatase [Chlamydiae bacterium]|nr:sodium-translocating pyrophosphatase [Chlamydiota bacterium]MBI3267196.1 sodium-translocating pyrophosphatase [Chlamydiota bacterium]
MTNPHYTSVERVLLWSILGVAISGLLYALMLVGQVLRAERGTEKMIQVAKAIRDGANAYLIRQFKTIALLIVVLTVALYYTGLGAGTHVAIGRAFAFLMGAIFSAMVGCVGMNLAVQGNLRVAAASRKSFGNALQIAYRTGTITGMLTDGLGLLGGTVIFMAYGEKAYEVLLGFGFGGTLLALFMRVGGGIYTKAADVGADIVGKIEAGIPEDDPRNAATIADNVGDNVGDCAGMAADIFESYEVTIVAAMILGYASFGHKGVIYPLLVRAIGVFSSIIGTYLVKAGDKGKASDAMKAINVGFWVSAAISIVGFMILGFLYLRFDPAYLLTWKIPSMENASFWITLGQSGLDMRPVWTTLIGIILAIVINRVTEYFTGTDFSPVKSLARSCQTGHATNIISGFAVGYESSVWAVLVIAGAILGSVLVYGGASATFVAYGVAMCGIGMLTLTGNNISMDVFGPVADNANGIGEMCHLEKEARQTLADLDAVGNTTKAITKGVAIGSAVIAAVSLFNSYITTVASGGGGETAIVTEAMKEFVSQLLTVADPKLFIGLLIGGAIPFLFSSLTIRAVGRAAFLIVKEVRTQFKIPGVREGTVTPDYGKVVSICTRAAQKELIGPGLLAVFTPLIVGYSLGVIGLAGFLAGLILCGQLLAVFMANAGGAWDNAKKTIEDGLYGGKGSEAHKASVTGDTVGDPLKDTAGPALNPLIKVMNMVSLLSIPLILPYDRHIIGLMNKFATARQMHDTAGNPLVFNHVTMGPAVYIGLAVAVLALVWTLWNSKRETAEMKQMDLAK